MLTAQQEASDLRALLGLDGWRHLVRHFAPQASLEDLESILEAARTSASEETLRTLRNRLTARQTIRTVLEWPARRLRELGA